MANLLTNASFENDTNGDGLPNDWVEEHTTASAATYSLDTTKNVDGAYALRMQKTGAVGDSNDKVEFYQYTGVGAFAEGEAAAFSIWLGGTVTNTYCQIVIEAHDAANAYIAEVNAACELSATPQEFRVNYPSLPAGTSIVVVAVLTPEFGATSTCDIYADMASLTKSTLAAITRRVNHITYPSFELGTTTPTGWTQSNSVLDAPVFELSTTTPGYGSKKLHVTFNAITTQASKVFQLISNTSVNGTFAPGDTAAVSMLIDGTATGCAVSLRIQFLTSVGGSAGTSEGATITLSGTPTRVSHTAVAPATTVAARVLIRVTGINTGDSFDLNMDGVLLENATSVGTYFDGDTAGFHWVGTANASTSRETISYVAPTNVGLNIGDVWKDATALKINIGDTWKTVTAMKINIGDVWKSVFSLLFTLSTIIKTFTNRL